MTVHSFSTQYNTEQLLPPDKHHITSHKARINNNNYYKQ